LADSIDTLPIEIQDHSKYLHYPVTEQDIRALLKQLPQGLSDGLSKITFCLGKQHQSFPEEPFYAEPERDPYLNRNSYVVFNDVYRPRCLGTYFVRLFEIKLYGYVYDSKIQDRKLCEFYLRLHMLMTFIHELSHHHDLSCRVAKGRWRADDSNKIENYAEQTAHHWMENYVIPYMKKTYPVDYKLLCQWMKEKVGIVVPLSLLAGDCRSTAKKGNIIIRSLFKTSTAFEEFVRNIQSGKDIISSRIDFAEDIHRAEEYQIAMQILDLVLKKDPKNIEAVVVYADILNHLEQYEESIKLSKKVLQWEKDNIDAYLDLCDSYESLEEWKLLQKYATIGCNLSTDWRGSFFYVAKIRAEIKLENLQQAGRSLLEVKERYNWKRVPMHIRRVESELKKELKKTKLR
jgi:hypothetical protein